MDDKNLNTEKILGKKENEAVLNRIALRIYSERDEKFYGFREQFFCIDTEGKRVPVLVQD